MHRLTTVLFLALLAPTSAYAQAIAPPPPGAYVASASVSDVLLPLIVAAEADIAAGRHELALGRAQLVLDSLEPTSTLRTRAEAVRELATAALGSEVSSPPIERVLEPLVEAAESVDAGAQPALAIARLDFVLQRVAPISTLGAAATARREQLSQPPDPASSPRTETAHSLGALPRASEHTVVVSVPDEFGDASPERAAGPVAPVDPTRRGDAEMVELYITGTLFGVYAGFFIPFASGLQGGSNRNPESLVYSLAVLAGGGLFALGISGLDVGPGLRTGIGPSISMGLRYGLAAGFMTWGALDPVLSPTLRGVCDPVGTFTCEENRAGLVERTGLPAGFGAAGALIGAMVGYGLRPTTQQVRMVEMGGLWGTAIGLLSSLGAAQDSAQGFTITATSMGLGLAGVAISTAFGVQLSGRRMGFMTLGLVAGAAVGMLAPLIALAATREWSWPILSITGATGLAGLVVAGVLTDGMTDGAARPDFHVSVSPMDGGGLASVSGSF
jgi:hypothetical protein